MKLFSKKKKNVWHTLKVKAIVSEVANSVRIDLALPQDLQNIFQFEAGQYITIKALSKKNEERRAYSICSPPWQKEYISILVKKIPHGAFSTYVEQTLSIGDFLEIQKPEGSFTLKTPSISSQGGAKIAFVAGSGITPIISMLHERKRIKDPSPFALFYLNKKQSNILFMKELEELEKGCSKWLSIHYLFSQQKTKNPLFNGRITAQKIVELNDAFSFAKPSARFLICGPYDMTQNITGALKQLGVKQQYILTELFYVPPEKKGKGKDVDDCKAECTIDASTSRPKIECIISTNKEKTLLESLIEQNIDVPYGCKKGVCRSCVAQVLEGEIELKKQYTLSKSEIANGEILTCCAYLKSNKRLRLKY